MNFPRGGSTLALVGACEESPASRQGRQCYPKSASGPPCREARTVPARAYVFLAFSLAAAFLWPLKPQILQPYIRLDPTAWFFCIGMVALSLSRFYGLRQAVPAPESYIFLYAVGLYYFEHHIPFQVRALDDRLLSFDYSFGYFELVVGRLFRGWQVFGAVLGFTYNTLMLAVVLLYLALPAVATRRKFVVAVVLAAIIILPLYALCPGAGPKYLLGDRLPGWFPDLSQPRDAIVVPAMNATPNGMNAIPSGHFAWALLIFWFARKYCSGAVPFAAGIFMVLTCLATLGTGEHYVIDLILAVPFAAGIWSLVQRHWRLAAMALGEVLIWLLSLREGWVLAMPPLLAWILTALTVSPFVLHRPGDRSGRS